MAGHEPIKENLVLTPRGRLRRQVHDGQLGPGHPRRHHREDRDHRHRQDQRPGHRCLGAADVTTNITFRIRSAAADAIPAQYRYRLLVSIPDSPTLDLCWFYGMVLRMQ